jgi:hypothetical protein
MATIHVSDKTAEVLTAQAAASGLNLDAYLALLARSASELDDQYIESGLQLARGQIQRGEISVTPIESIVAKAQNRHQPRT